MTHFTHYAAFCESEAARSHSTLCDPVDCSPLGSSIHGILQARVLEWAAISFSRRSSRPRDQTWVSRIAGRPLSHQGSPYGVLCNMSISCEEDGHSLPSSPFRLWEWKQGYQDTTPCVPQSSSSSVHFCTMCVEHLLCTLYCRR